MSLYVNGQRCTWWDTPENAAKSIVPACPYCGGPVATWEVSDWWDRVNDTEKNLPGYRKLIEWGRGKCFEDFEHLQAAFNHARKMN